MTTAETLYLIKDGGIEKNNLEPIEKFCYTYKVKELTLNADIFIT